MTLLLPLLIFLCLPPPHLMLGESFNQEILCFSEVFSDSGKRLLDLLLGLIKGFNVLFDLIDTYLESIVLSVLVIHGEETLQSLLEIMLPFLVLKLVLTDVY